MQLEVWLFDDHYGADAEAAYRILPLRGIMKNDRRSALAPKIELKRGPQDGSKDSEHCLRPLPVAENRAEPSITLGSLEAWDELGRPLVDYPGNPVPHFLMARSIVVLNRSAVGREVALSFINGDPGRPLIVGLLEPAPTAEGRPLTAELDGERLVFTASREIVLRCGASSITLTHAGKVIIRGAYLLSRSTGANRIKGGSVQIN